MNPVIYIFLNKELQMSVGKAAAQAAHALAMALLSNTSSGEAPRFWLESPHRTIIVLEARDEAHMKNIRAYLAERKIATARIIDEGVNEIDPHVWTALSTCLLDKDADYVKDSMSTFKLYRDKIKVTLEVER